MRPKCGDAFADATAIVTKPETNINETMNLRMIVAFSQSSRDAMGSQTGLPYFYLCVTQHYVRHSACQIHEIDFANWTGQICDEFLSAFAACEVQMKTTGNRSVTMAIQCPVRAFENDQWRSFG